VTAAYRWCTLYVDTPDPSTVAEALAGLLGPGDHLSVFRVPGFTVDVRRNPDRTRGPHFLDWPSTVDIDASGDAADTEVVAFVTRLVDHLHAAGLRVAPDCDFTPDLPPPDRSP
jgi:hypothetical protein